MESVFPSTLSAMIRVSPRHGIITLKDRFVRLIQSHELPDRNSPAYASALRKRHAAILGICAGLLWTAQGSLMLAYPTEDQKGLFIGIFWSIFNLGGVVGASVSLGQNFHSEVRVLPMSRCVPPTRRATR